MAWGKAGSTTLTSAGDTVTVSGLSDNKYFTVLGYKQSSGTSDFNWRVGNGSADSGNNYARRQSSNGGSDTTNTGYSRMFADNGGASTPSFQVGYFVNIATEEKLNITHSVSQSTAGAGTAPDIRESVNKWANTSDLIDVIQGVNVEGGDFASGSNVSVLGSDLTTSSNKPTDVQEGSRFEETDTRKMYHYFESGGTDIQDKTLVQNGDDITYSGGVIDVNIGSSSSSEGDYLLHTLNVPITTTDFVLDFDYKRVSGGTGVFGGLVFRSNQSGESVENSNTGDYIRTSPNAAGSSMNMYWHNDGDSTETELGYLTGLNSAGSWNYLRLTRTNGTNIKLERFSSSARSGSADAEAAVTNLSATWGLSLKYIGGYCAYASGGGLEEHFDNIDLSSTTKLWKELGT
jgi:hypothetical protein